MLYFVTVVHGSFQKFFHRSDRLRFSGTLPGVRHVFHDGNARKAFVDDFLDLARSHGAKINLHLKDLIFKHRKQLYAVDYQSVVFALIDELMAHDEVSQGYFFPLLVDLPEQGQALAVSFILTNTAYPGIRIGAIRAIPQFTYLIVRTRLYQTAQNILKKELFSRDKSRRNHAVDAIPELPVQRQLRLFSMIFRSSYRHHNAQLRAVRRLKKLPDDGKLQMIERIIRMRDVDEKMILDSLELVPEMDDEHRYRLIYRALKNAPYDLVSIRVIDFFSLLTDSKKNDAIYRAGLKSIRTAMNQDDDHVRSMAVSAIARFPESYRNKLVRYAQDSYYNDVKTISLRHLLTLNENHKIEIISFILKKMERVVDWDNPTVRSVRMISFVGDSNRSRLYELAGEKLRIQLEGFIRAPYHYETLYLIRAVHFMPSGFDRLAETASIAIKTVLKDNKKIHQLAGIHRILDLPESYRRDLILQALDSEYEEAILNTKKIIMMASEEQKEDLSALFLDRVIQKQIREEIKKYELQEIYESLRRISSIRLLDLFDHLNESRIFSVLNLSRLLLRATKDAGLASDRLLDLISDRIRSDNEKILLLHDFLFAHREHFSNLDVRHGRVLYRIALTRLKKKEKGLSGDLIALFREILQGNIDPVKEERIILDYILEDGIKVFDFLIYEKYRRMKKDERRDFVHIINDLTGSILGGFSFKHVREEIERAGIDDSVNNDFVFAILLQLIPIDSSHLNRNEARRIFFDSMKRETDIMGDLKRAAPELVDEKTGAGITIVRPSFEVIRIQTNPFSFKYIPQLFEHMDDSGSIRDPGDLLYVLRTPDRETFRKHTFYYLIYQLRDQMEEIRHKFRNIHSRYEALNALLDLLNDTFRETLQAAVFRVRQHYSRDQVAGILEELQSRLETVIPTVRYIGALKPVAVKNVLLNTYLKRDLSLSRFVVENKMYYDDDEPRKLTWSKFLALLRNPKIKKLYDPYLADKLEQELAHINHSENRDKTEMLKHQKDLDPIMRLFDIMEDYIMGDIKSECEAGVDSFDQEERVPGSDVQYQVGKSAWLSIYGGLADICIARDMRLFSRDNFTLLSMIQDDKYVGFNLIHFVNEGDEKILVLAGCEPANFYAAKHTPKQIFSEVVEVLIELAERTGMDRLVQIADDNAFSNREKVKRYIKKNVSKSKPDGFFNKSLYLGSYSVTTFKSFGYYTLWSISRN